MNRLKRFARHLEAQRRFSRNEVCARTEAKCHVRRVVPHDLNRKLYGLA